MAADYRPITIRASCWSVLLLCLHFAQAFYIPGALQGHHAPAPATKD